MTDSDIHPLEAILRWCAEAAPEPWYPSAYARSVGVARDSLDPYLDQLRMGGLIQLTEWVPVHGQGYILTPVGVQLLDSPRLMARLRNGQLPDRREAPPEPLQRELRSPIWERAEAARQAFMGPGSSRVTFALIYVNVLVFLFGLFLAWRDGVPLNDFVYQSTPKILQKTGAVAGADLYVRHEWWRLLTCCFVHIGLLHLSVNMYSLYAIGPLLERMWGSWRFLVLYLIAGLGGSCAMVIENPFGGGAGASGALWGILASLAAWIFLNRRVLPPDLVSQWRRQLLTIFILNVWITYSFANISKGAHFGGGVVGLITAVPLDYLRFGRRWQKWLALAALFLIPVLCVAALVRSFEKTGEEISIRKDIAFFFDSLPKIQEVSQRTDALYSSIRKNHQEMEARQALADLVSQENSLAKLSEFLQSHELMNPDVRKARQLAINYLDSQITLLQALEDYFKPGKTWTEKDNLNLERLEQRKLEREKQFKKLLKETND